ncbi:MAG: hypothetical protein KKD77_20255, partial [Gammaproteobacteria bacterium]|nr:hypothetical protein [Gammaproteobacteria bacterium]
MSLTRIANIGLIPVGEQKISLSGTQQTAINTTCRAADVVVFSVETANVRVGFGASATYPTATTGVLYVANTTNWITGFNRTSMCRFARVTGAPVVNIAAFRYVGQ